MAVYHGVESGWNAADSIQRTNSIYAFQTFAAPWAFDQVEVFLPTYQTTTSDLRMELWTRTGTNTWNTQVAVLRIDNHLDNAWAVLPLSTPSPAGTYAVRVYNLAGSIGWWRNGNDPYADGAAYYFDGQVPSARAGDYIFRIRQSAPAIPAKRWDGSAWQDVSISKRWTGSAWTDATITVTK